MKLLMFILVFGCLQSCHTTQYQSGQLPDRQLVFGSGGGFSGMEKTYSLLENGQFWVQERPGAELVALPAIPRSTARKLFAIASEKLYGQVALNTIGNTYRFAGFQDSSRHARMTWSGKRPQIDPALATLLDELFQLIPQE